MYAVGVVVMVRPELHVMTLDTLQSGCKLRVTFVHRVVVGLRLSLGLTPSLGASLRLSIGLSLSFER